MNIGNSGKIPDLIKKAAAVAVILSITLCAGCVSTETSGEPISAVDESTAHVPEESGTQSTESSVPFESSAVSSSSSSSSPASNSTSFSDTSSGGNSSGAAQSSEQSSAEIPVVSETSSSESPPPVSSEPVSTPDPPPVVTIPNVAIPTSPGTQCAVAANGAIDYSNAAQGYISARYTGGSSKMKLRIASGGEKYDHDLDANGSTEYFPLSFGGGEYTVTIYENISGKDYGEVVSQTFYADTNSRLPFLYPNRYSDFSSGSNCVYKAAEVCAGKTSDIDKIAAIFVWVTDNIVYDHALAETVKTGYVPNPDRTYNSRTGICFDYASLMCAMLRSQSIPTRLVIGYASPDIYHAWNEVYTEETGWITPELMLKNTGYNIADSTFYASAGDKSQIAAYISNSSNYMVRYYY